MAEEEWTLKLRVLKKLPPGSSIQLATAIKLSPINCHLSSASVIQHLSKPTPGQAPHSH
jgi:hypothetical protein